MHAWTDNSIVQGIIQSFSGSNQLSSSPTLGLTALQVKLSHSSLLYILLVQLADVEKCVGVIENNENISPAVSFS